VSPVCHLCVASATCVSPPVFVMNDNEVGACWASGLGGSAWVKGNDRHELLSNPEEM